MEATTRLPTNSPGWRESVTPHVRSMITCRSVSTVGIPTLWDFVQPSGCRGTSGSGSRRLPKRKFSSETGLDPPKSGALVGVPTRLLFIGCLEGSRASSLYYIEIDSNRMEVVGDEGSNSFKWRPLIAPDALSRASNPTKEELLLRERQRSVISRGLTSFVRSRACNTVVTTVGGRLYRTHAEDEGTTGLEELSSDNTNCSDPKFNGDGMLLAYVHDCNIYVKDMRTLVDVQVTFEGEAPDGKECGVAEYVMQEEFDRYTGYWWCPVPETVDDGVVWRILYLVTDGTEVQTLQVVDAVDFSVEMFRRPQAGGKNVVSHVRVAEILVPHGAGCVSQAHISNKALTPGLNTMFPWCEYIVRAGWAHSSEKVYLQIMNRGQSRLDLIMLDLNLHFTTMTDPPPSYDRNGGIGNHAPALVLCSLMSGKWVNVADLIEFSPHTWRRCIFSSECSGFRHLMELTVRPATISNSLPAVERRELTSGDWQVDGDDMWVDWDRELVYFTGTKDSVLEKRLYVTSIRARGEGLVHCLTMQRGTHNVSISSDFSFVVDTYSSMSEPPRTEVYKLVHPGADDPCSMIPLHTIEHSHPPMTPSFPFYPPELFSYRNRSGMIIHGCIYKPPNFSTSKRWPTLLHIYGGPRMQLVTNDYRMTMWLKLQLIACRGYVVVMIDTPGSSRRGLEFEGAMKWKMGTFEIEEQVQGLKLLMDRGIVDPERIAIMGWSYGGYMALMALAQRPDVFKVAISGAPVTTWEKYDSAYTECYMGLPRENPEGYRAGSVLEYVNDLPDERDRLFLMHGLVDDNVLWTHTAQLIDALIKANKPYNLQVFPKERHGLRDGLSVQHAEINVLSILETYMP